MQRKVFSGRSKNGLIALEKQIKKLNIRMHGEVASHMETVHTENLAAELITEISPVLSTGF